MAAVGRNAVVATLLAFVLIASAVVLSAAGQNDTVPARILTIAGETTGGSLSGILPTVRLDASALTDYVGPFQAFDIPRETIHQITLDFPRVVVETDDRVFVGPYSAYRGIAERLTLQRGATRLSLPTASLRAIALNGYGFHPVPREWLANTFLVMPLSTTRTALTQSVKVPAEQPRPSPATTGQPVTASQPEEETAGWIGTLIVIVLIALVVFSLNLGGG